MTRGKTQCRPSPLGGVFFLSEFAAVMTDLRNLQAEMLINNGLTGNYASTITKVMLTKHGYVDKQEVKADVTQTVKTIEIEHR